MGNIKITVYIDLPWHTEELVKAIEVHPKEAECLKPLSRDRELFAESAIRAREQIIDRQALIKYLARHLAFYLQDAIASSVESRDPQQGYPPEEWKKLNA